MFTFIFTLTFTFTFTFTLHYITSTFTIQPPYCPTWIKAPLLLCTFFYTFCSFFLDLSPYLSMSCPHLCSLGKGRILVKPRNWLQPKQSLRQTNTLLNWSSTAYTRGQPLNQTNVPEIWKSSTLSSIFVKTLINYQTIQKISKWSHLFCSKHNSCTLFGKSAHSICSVCFKLGEACAHQNGFFLEILRIAPQRLS